MEDTTALPSSVLVCPQLSQNEIHTLLKLTFCFRKPFSIKYSCKIKPVASSHVQTKTDLSVSTLEENRTTVEAGEKATFVVHVQFRQNATWQGTIQWIESKKTQKFRSTLELIRLMDEALQNGEEVKFEGWNG